MVNLKELLTRNIEEIIEQPSLEKKLKSGKALRIKYGADPSRPDLHLGHAIGLRKLKEFQDLGHTIIFIIGDFTAKIGDPSEKNKTRPQLSDEEILKNTQTYLDQVGMILDIKKIEIRKNSEWYSKFNLAQILDLASKFTVARVIERDDFEKRLKNGSDISMHELLYPLLQAYDSVEIKADVEIGGTDQKFNMLAGRALQRKMNLTQQDVITMPLLVGLDGTEKMSKSLDNYIGLAESAQEQYGKIMSIPDKLIIDYYKLITDLSENEVEKIEKSIKSGKVNPRDAKAELAHQVVKMFHDEEEAQKAADEFDRIFKMGEVPEDIKEVKIDTPTCLLPDLLVSSGIITSKSEAKRLISQGGVKVDGETMKNKDSEIKVKDGMVLKVGRRKFVKIKH